MGTHGVKMAYVGETKSDVANLLNSDNVKTYSHGKLDNVDGVVSIQVASIFIYLFIY